MVYISKTLKRNVVTIRNLTQLWTLDKILCGHLWPNKKIKMEEYSY